MDYMQSYDTMQYCIIYNTILYCTYILFILQITKYNYRNTQIPFATLYGYTYIDILVYKQSNRRYIDFLQTVDNTPDTHTDTHIDIAGHHHRRLYHLSPTLPSSALTPDPSCRDILEHICTKTKTKTKSTKIKQKL